MTYCTRLWFPYASLWIVMLLHHSCEWLRYNDIATTLPCMTIAGILHNTYDEACLQLCCVILRLCDALLGPYSSQLFCGQSYECAKASGDEIDEYIKMNMMNLPTTDNITAIKQSRANPCVFYGALLYFMHPPRITVCSRGILLVTPCLLTRIREFIHTQHRNTTRGRRPSVVLRC